MTLRTLRHRRIPTRTPAGEDNGFLLEIYNGHDGFVADGREPRQVYLTVCRPGQRKGPHLHMKRWGYFTCIAGNARVVAKIGDEYAIEYTGEDHEFRTIEVPAGAPALLENIGDVDAYILNTPSPAWSAADPDDHPVLDWSPPDAVRRVHPRDRGRTC